MHHGEEIIFRLVGVFSLRLVLKTDTSKKFLFTPLVHNILLFIFFQCLVSQLWSSMV